jgi:hypothetical protein
MKKQTHRKDAKNAKLLCVFVKEFLCVLCVSAVKTVFMDEHWIEKMGIHPACKHPAFSAFGIGIFPCHSVCFRGHSGSPVVITRMETGW